MIASELLIELTQEALLLALVCALPPVVAIALAGAAAGLAQGLTGVRDPSLGIAPRLVAALLALAVAAPWILDQLVAFSAPLMAALGEVQVR